MPLDLHAFQPITLDKMSAVKLMNRVDTKYVTTTRELGRLLQLLVDDYYIQESTDGLRNFPYHTIYFDTESQQMYATHHSGKKTRQKIRMRCYESTGDNFLEIKLKNNKGRTKKKRIEIDEMEESTSRYADFIAAYSAFQSNQLTQQLENWFTRVTLVNRRFTERLTIDTNLRFNNLVTGGRQELVNIAIIELKRDGLTDSPVLRRMRELRIKPSGFSKYCMGMVFTNPNVRTNRFKERVRMVEKLNQPF